MSDNLTRDKVFLDTNIFVYCFDNTAPLKSKIANTLVTKALETGYGLVSYQVVQEFFNVALRRFKPAFTAHDAERYFSMVFQPLLAVHSSPSLYFQALSLKSRYQLAWYDSLIVAGAAESGCTALVTEDMQHGLKIESLRIVNPFLTT